MGLRLVCTDIIETDLVMPQGSTFTRTSSAYLSTGTRVEAGVPRLEKGGITVEEGTLNLLSATDSQGFSSPVNVTVTSGQSYTVSMYGDGSITLSGAGTGTVTKDNPVTFTATSDTLTLTPNGSTGKVQVGNKLYKTSWQIGGEQREDEKYTVDVTGKYSEAEGTIEFTVMPFQSSAVLAPTGKTFSGFIDFGFYSYVSSQSKGVIFRRNREIDKVEFRYYKDGNGYSISYAKAFSSLQKIKVAFKWDATKVYYFVDGVKIGESVKFDFPTNNVIAFGGLSASSSHNIGNGIYSDLHISSIARSDDDIYRRSLAPLYSKDQYTTLACDFKQKIKITEDGKIYCSEFIEE